MKPRNQGIQRTASVLGMIALLALVALAPMVGGFVQRQHRSQRQNSLRRERQHLSAVRIVLPESKAKTCLIPKKNELELDGLRYDVVSCEQVGSNLIFSAVPDIRETRIGAFTLQSILFPGKDGGAKTKMASLFYFLPGFQGLAQMPELWKRSKTAFSNVPVVLLPGFIWKYSPPPELVTAISV